LTDAVHWPFSDKLVERIRRFCSAAILEVLLASAKLCVLRRIDAPETNARVMDFDRIAVDDTGLSNKIIGLCRSRNNDDRLDEQGRGKRLKSDHCLRFASASLTIT
jgi:hypothetical protein